MHGWLLAGRQQADKRARHYASQPVTKPKMENGMELPRRGWQVHPQSPPLWDCQHHARMTGRPVALCRASGSLPAVPGDAAGCFSLMGGKFRP